MTDARVALASMMLIALIFLSGCSDPREYEIAKLTEEQKKELGENLTADEGQKLTGWMMRTALSGQELPPGITVAQALAQQDEWAAEQKAQEVAQVELAKRVEAERKAKQEEFARLLSVALVSKENSLGEYGQRWIDLAVAYENKSDKDIEGVKGVLRLNDIFGDKIMDVNWSYDGGIPAKGSIVERDSGIEINQFIDRHMKLWSTDFEKLKATYEVSTIIFEDGTKIDAPE